VLVVLLSTLFTGQHVVLDVLGGVVLAGLGYTVGMVLAPVRKQTAKD